MTTPRDALGRYVQSHLKIRHLELLVALNDRGSLARVAEHLHVTQPALSKTLAMLEDGLGLTLFERTPRGLIATETGECLVHHARTVLGELREAQHNLRTIAAGRRVRTAIGTLPAAAAAILPQFIAALEARAPEVRIAVREDTSEGLLTRLQSGDIDFAVSFLPDKPLAAPLAADTLLADHIVAVARCGHPLARAATLAPAALMDYPLVLPPHPGVVRTMIDGFWQRHGIALPHHQVESLSLLTNVGVVQHSDAVALLLGSVAQHFARQGLLAVLPLAFAQLHLRLGLIWRTDREPNRAHALVRQVFQEVRPGSTAWAQAPAASGE